jgi:RNA polymerase sigma-70 factor (ECF subfamily)
MFSPDVNRAGCFLDNREERGDRVPSADPGAGADRSRDSTARRLREVAAGSHQAFEALYRETAPSVGRYLASLGATHPLLSDLLQDTYLAVWRDAGRYVGPAAPLAWILGIARHKLGDYWRTNREIPVKDPRPETADVAQTGYEAARVAEVLAALSPADRELVQLVFGADLGYRDVARLLDVPVGTVKSRVFRLRKMVREWEGTHAD